MAVEVLVFFGGYLSLEDFLAGNLNPNYFVDIANREIWRRNPNEKVRAWDLKIALAAADAARMREEDESVHYPQYLQVVDDCYTFYIGSVKRVRTYQVVDESGNRYAGSVVVRETNNVAYGILDPNASNQSWTTITFDDHLARGYGEDILQYQQFTVTYTLPNGMQTTTPIAVRERNGQTFGTQGIKMMQDKVMMNRDDGTGIGRCDR
jgi:hypothetical protein